MTTTILQESQSLAAGPQSAEESELAGALRHDLTSYSGPSITFGIMIAGGAYPIVLAVIYFVVALVFVLTGLITGASRIPTYELGQGLVFVVTAGVFCAFIGVVWAAIVAALTMPVVYLFLRSLKLRGTLIRLGASCGGLVGFIAVLPPTLSLPWTLGFTDATALAIILALGPGLTTIMGQIGGAWGGMRAARFAKLIDASAFAAASPELTDVLGRSADNSLPESSAEDRRFQFGIRHVLWIFVWLSLILSLIKLSRVPFEFVLPLLIGWFIFQLATLRIGATLAGRLGPWWANRRSRRST